MLIPLSRTIRRDFRPPCNIVYRDIAPFTINIVKPRTANASKFIVHFRQISCKIEHSIQEIRCITAQVLAILFRQLVSLMPNDIGLLSMFFFFLQSRLTFLRIEITLRLIASATARITFSRSPASICRIHAPILACLMPTCTFVYLNHPIVLPSLLRCLQTLHFLPFLRAVLPRRMFCRQVYALSRSEQTACSQLLFLSAQADPNRATTATCACSMVPRTGTVE